MRCCCVSHDGVASLLSLSSNDPEDVYGKRPLPKQGGSLIKPSSAIITAVADEPIVMTHAMNIVRPCQIMIKQHRFVCALDTAVAGTAM